MDNVFKNIEEEIELSIDTTIKIAVQLTSKQFADVETSFKSFIDSTSGAIVISPENPNISIIDAKLITPVVPSESIKDNEGMTITTYPLDIHMICQDPRDAEVTVTVDEIGQAIILPIHETSQFISAARSSEGEIELITEDTVNDKGSSESNTESQAKEENETSSVPDKPDPQKPETVIKDEEEPLPEVQAKVVKESLEAVDPPITEGEDPYDKETIRSILVEITDNFSTPNGVIKCGFDEEVTFAKEILTENDYYYDIVPNGDWHIISYAKRKENPSPVQESYEGTFDENRQLAISVLDDIEMLMTQLQLKADKLCEYFEILNFDIEKVTLFKNTIDQLMMNSFDDISLDGLKADLSGGQF